MNNELKQNMMMEEAIASAELAMPSLKQRIVDLLPKEKDIGMNDSEFKQNYNWGANDTLMVIKSNKVLDQIIELVKSEVQIEHCGEENCPECNKEAFKTGYEKAREEMINEVLQITNHWKTYDDKSSQLVDDIHLKIKDLLSNQSK